MADFTEILRFFPGPLRAAWENCGLGQARIYEIRLRAGRHVRAIGEQETVLPMVYGERELDDIFRHLCRDSVYAYDGERRQGFMTVEGGHRIGITGELEPSAQGGFIVKYVRYMNIRIAHQIKNIAGQVMPYICCGDSDAGGGMGRMECRLKSTLIVSPPGIGKTTLLRDIIRLASDGFGAYGGCNVGVVDERGELAGAYRGGASLDCGERTDIVTGGDKLQGIGILVRTFSPRVVAIDEIGRGEDAEAILYAGVSGCSVLATAHGGSLEEVSKKKEMERIFGLRLFERYIVLSMDGRDFPGKKRDRYFCVYGREGEELCGRSLLREPL